jgi:DNA-binding PucR family transcriptional regulator
LILAARIAAALARPVAVSLPFGSPDDRAAAEAGARETLHAWERLVEADPAVEEGSSAARVVRADRLPVFRLLGGLHNLPDGRRQARALLAPLLAGSPSLRTERLRTLRALLDAPGPVEAAARLGVHRNTIAYRISRIESTTGWRLDDPELRLALSLAVRLVQSDQEQET